jgi:hypothetical protein
MSNELIRHLISKIDADCATIERQLALGHAKDIGDYKFACGRYRGLLNAKDILIITAESMENDDDF